MRNYAVLMLNVCTHTHIHTRVYSITANEPGNAGPSSRLVLLAGGINQAALGRQRQFWIGVGV